MKRNKMGRHNKKRNIGIIYELLLRQISHSLIENNIKDVKRVTAIIEKRLNKNTELFKEFRLVNALINTRVKSTESAAAILSEAKEASRRSSPTDIDTEKSRLIRDINHNIKDKNFYYRNVPNYIDYANVQNLLNEWRKKDRSNLKKMAELEGKVIEILLKEKVNNDIYDEKRRLDSSESDGLVMKIMTEKINQKYSNMSDDQKLIIKNYALYNNTESSSKLFKFLSEQKTKCLDELKMFEATNKNEFIQRKIKNVQNKVELLNEHNVNDETIVKFMTVSKLISELKGE